MPLLRTLSPKDFGLPFDPKAFDRYSFILRAKKIYAPWNNDNADAEPIAKD